MEEISFYFIKEIRFSYDGQPVNSSLHLSGVLLYIIIWYQIFLSNANNLQTILSTNGTLAGTNTPSQIRLGSNCIINIWSTLFPCLKGDMPSKFMLLFKIYWLAWFLYLMAYQTSWVIWCQNLNKSEVVALFNT